MDSGILDQVNEMTKFRVIGAGIEVRKSEVNERAGLGLFLNTPAKAGEILTVYDGYLIQKDSLPRIHGLWVSIFVSLGLGSCVGFAI